MTPLKVMVCIVAASIVIPTAALAQGATKNAPGHEQKKPGQAKQFAPGHEQKRPGQAKQYSPGHEMKK